MPHLSGCAAFPSSTHGLLGGGTAQSFPPGDPGLASLYDFIGRRNLPFLMVSLPLLLVFLSKSSSPPCCPTSARCYRAGSGPKLRHQLATMLAQVFARRPMHLAMTSSPCFMSTCHSAWTGRFSGLKGSGSFILLPKISLLMDWCAPWLGLFRCNSKAARTLNFLFEC